MYNDVKEQIKMLDKIKVDGILGNVVSSSSQKSGDVVTVTIEGELPWEKF